MRRTHALVHFLFLVGLVGAMVPMGSAHADLVDEAVLDYRLGLFNDAFARMLRIANADHPHAMFWIGKMYETGRGTDQNLVLAHDFYQRAALLNDADAQNNLGLIYKYAKGQERDIATAMAWFSIAATQGHRVARDNRDITDSALTAEERSSVATQITVLRNEIQRTLLARRSRPVTPAGELAVYPNSQTPSADSEKSSTATSPVPNPPEDARIPDIQEKADLKNGSAAVIDRSDLMTPAEPNDWEPAEIVMSTSTREVSLLARSKRPPATKQSYVVQLGIFRNPTNVERIRAVAASNGIDLEADKILVGGRTHARLRHGGYVTRAEAAGIAQRINQLFNVTSLVVRTSH